MAPIEMQRKESRYGEDSRTVPRKSLWRLKNRRNERKFRKFTVTFVTALIFIEEEEDPLNALDQYFKKTKAKPMIYYLPLTEEDVKTKEREIEEKKKVEETKVKREEGKKTGKLNTADQEKNNAAENEPAKPREKNLAAAKSGKATEQAVSSK